ncbi:hypothetical protein RSAG8_00171, partial [Rhizoctonia solani AG-8 WAC10335]
MKQEVNVSRAPQCASTDRYPRSEPEPIPVWTVRLARVPRNHRAASSAVTTMHMDRWAAIDSLEVTTEEEEAIVPLDRFSYVGCDRKPHKASGRLQPIPLALELEQTRNENNPRMRSPLHYSTRQQ